MEEVINELRKLNAEVVEEYCGLYTINGVKVAISKRETGTGRIKRVVYTVGSKDFTSVKNLAYYTITELIPYRKNLDAVEQFVETLGDPAGAVVGVRSQDFIVVAIRVTDVNQLKEAIKEIAKHC